MLPIFRSLPLVPLEEGPPPAPSAPATVEATLAESDVNDSNQTSNQQVCQSTISNQQTCGGSTIQQTDV